MQLHNKISKLWEVESEIGILNIYRQYNFLLDKVYLESLR